MGLIKVDDGFDHDMREWIDSAGTVGMYPARHDGFDPTVAILEPFMESYPEFIDQFLGKVQRDVPLLQVFFKIGPEEVVNSPGPISTERILEHHRQVLEMKELDSFTEISGWLPRYLGANFDQLLDLRFIRAGCQLCLCFKGFKGFKGFDVPVIPIQDTFPEDNRTFVELLRLLVGRLQEPPLQIFNMPFDTLLQKPVPPPTDVARGSTATHKGIDHFRLAHPRLIPNVIALPLFGMCLFRLSPIAGCLIKSSNETLVVEEIDWLVLKRERH